MNASARKRARPAAGAKPAVGADERVWTLFQIAFSNLIRPYRRSSASRYDECDEFESAQDIAHLAMMMALAAAHKFENYEKRNSTPGRAQGRSRRVIAAAEEALPT